MTYNNLLRKSRGTDYSKFELMLLYLSYPEYVVRNEAGEFEKIGELMVQVYSG
jgi:hypothetical protein